MVLAPGGEARGDQLGRGGVDRFLAVADFGAQPRFGFGQRQARQAGVDEIADLARAPPPSCPASSETIAVLDAAVGADQHRQRAGVAQRHEVELLEPQLPLRREHHAGAWRQARQRRRGRRERILDRLVADDLPLDLGAARADRAPRPA